MDKGLGFGQIWIEMATPRALDARHTIISLIEPDMAHMKLMAVNPMAENVNR